MSSELNDMSYSYSYIYSYRHFIVFQISRCMLIYYSRHNHAAGAYSQTLSWSMEGEACLYHFQRNINIAIIAISWAKQSHAWKRLNMHAPCTSLIWHHACMHYAHTHAGTGYWLYMPYQMAILHPPWTVTRWLHEIWLDFRTAIPQYFSRCNPPPLLQCTSHKYTAIYSYIAIYYRCAKVI